ncbi:hypothetical protein ACHAWX_003502 [Stephanocyclus meneghinianus]
MFSSINPTSTPSHHQSAYKYKCCYGTVLYKTMNRGSESSRPPHTRHVRSMFVGTRSSVIVVLGAALSSIRAPHRHAAIPIVEAFSSRLSTLSHTKSIYPEKAGLDPVRFLSTPDLPSPLDRPSLPLRRRRNARCLDKPASLYSSLSSAEEEPKQTPRLDRILSKLTSLFPLFVLGSAILGSYCPDSLNWVNRGNSISYMLAGVMLGTGMTLERADFTNILASPSRRTSIPLGVLCQFILMPLSAAMIGRTFLLPHGDPLGKHLFLGLVLVGCSPGGTASNLVSLIAGADVALSVLLTACSTILASVVTPLLTKWIVGSTVAVSGRSLCLATAKVVLAPVTLGVILNEKMPKLSRWISRFTPFASVLLVGLICGGVVANNAALLAGTGARATSLSGLVLASVFATHALGFAAGYSVPHSLGFSETTSRTISIETGMQNSALAVVLAKSIGADPLSCLPGAVSATVHSCLGSGLAAFWRMRDSRKRERMNG